MSSDRTLAGTKLLATVPEDRISALDARCRWRSFEPDEVIVNLHDQTTDIYFIARGEVRVTVFSQTGRTVIMRDFKAGDHFGEYAAIDGEPRSASIVALNRTVVAQMPAQTFQDLLGEFPGISLAVMVSMAGAIRTLNERVVEFSTLGVRNRIHAELLRLARAGRIVEGTGRISPPPTHAEIASRISTHREAVTRELKQLENQALLERTRGAFVIKDLQELERMVEDARAGRSE
jgi:CRP/FNR family transcriptional regulator, cyclic AMP receptor protein